MDVLILNRFSGDVEYIRNNVSDAVLYEQLAEECNELAKAALKKARKLRNENYTPKTMEEINNELYEEFTDVMLVSDTCQLTIDPETYRDKLKRWRARLSNAETNLF